MGKSYPPNLPDAEWHLLKSHLPSPKRRGRPRIRGFREILDAVFYVLRSGCAWRLLPRDFPPWETVYHYFRRWSLDGTWERLNHTIRDRKSTRLNSSHANISYAVFCLKKKNNITRPHLHVSLDTSE